MAKNNTEYQIERTTYRYKDTGKKDSKGHNIFEPVGQPKTSIVKGVNNFTELKKKLYDADVKNDKMTIKYKNQTYTELTNNFGKTTGIRKNPREIDYVHKSLGNGEYERTYYRAKKK